MGRLDIRDVPRDEDSVDDPTNERSEKGDDRPLTESQMTVWDCIAEAEQSA
jgi:hypothetical protein